MAPTCIGMSCSSPLRAVGTGIPHSGTLCGEITEVPPLSERKEKSILFSPGFAIIPSSASHGFHVINHFQNSVHGWRRRFRPILEYMRISGFFHRRGGNSLHSYFTRSYIYNCSCRHRHTGTTCRKIEYLCVCNCPHTVASDEPACWK